MARSSIDVIEEALGGRLFPKAWTARSFAEIDDSDPAYRVPSISRTQFQDIQERLHAHWQESIRTTRRADRGTLLVCSGMVTRLHQYPALLDADPLSRLAGSAREFSILMRPQIGLDEAVIARKALLYCSAATIRDPAELLRRPPKVTERTVSNVLSIGLRDEDLWKDLWRSAVCGLGNVHRLVRTGIVTLYPSATLLDAATNRRSGLFARRHDRQEGELRALYRARAWQAAMAGLPFDDTEEAGLYTGLALGQFAWRNVVLPGATPWLPNAQCAAALQGLERILKGQIVGQESMTLARLSSRVGIDLGKVSDDDIIALREGEELFATWRHLVAELGLEVERLGIENAADVTTLVKAKEALWRAAFERETGRGGVLSGLFDANPVVCGVITGGTALASGMSAPLVAASALGGGLVTPVMRLIGNLSEAGARTRRRRAIHAHFMAIEGPGR